MTPSPQLQQRLVGIAAILAGIMVLLMAQGIIPVGEDQIRTPIFVVYLGGIIFIATGLMAIATVRFFVHLCGLAIYLSFATVLWWITLSAPDWLFDGRSLFLSRDTSVFFSRLLSGTLATLATGVLIYAIAKVIAQTR
ncbi:MAG: hypothetical protein AAF387_21300 [Pseudomonadota bacterium]